MSKFKIGDKVIAKRGAPYLTTTNGWAGTVVEVCSDGSFTANGKGLFSKDVNFSNLNEKYFDLVTNVEKKIVITTDGIKTVTAKLYEGKKVIKTAEAKCSPKNKFDFGYGVMLAVERLTGHESIEEVTDDKSSLKDVIDSFERLIKFSEKILARGKPNGSGKNL